MKVKTSFFVLWFAIISSEILAQSVYEDRVAQQFHNLDSEVNLSSEVLSTLMPKNWNQALFYFRLDYKDSTSRYYRKLDKLINDKIQNGDRRILSSYLRLSEFVDGYFAEAYFDHIDHIAENQTEIFCQEISALPDEHVSRLSSIRKEKCEN